VEWYTEHIRVKRSVLYSMQRFVATYRA